MVGNKIIKRLESSDGETKKYLLALEDGQTVESVLMKCSHGFTVCISTQVGCKMGCAFCVTAKGGFSRNLTPSEMLLQIEEIQNKEDIKISNVVLMGMGEPLDNFENVLNFLKLLTNPKGLNIGEHHISVSTCGVVDKIYKLAEDKPQFTLSISLHATDDETRTKIMKINKRWNIAELLKACRHYTELTNRRIWFEYVMINNLNDSHEDAKKLANLLKGMLCRVDLIPVNDSGQEEFKPSPKEKVSAFLDTLQKEGINANVRRTLGLDIKAACGQLKAGVVNFNEIKEM